MISVQVPQFFNHPLPAYSPMSMSQSGFFNGMSAFSKPSPMSSFISPAEKPKMNQNGKRRPSRAGTRSVATLTAAQLERKRANDREAQRAIRQRTKDHIESLERRITELTSTNDLNARLAQALQRNDELDQENKLLRSRINNSVAALAEGQPITPEMLTGPASPTRRLRVATRASSVPTVPTVPRSIPAAINTMQPQEHWNPAFNSPVTSGMDRSPSLADVSPISTTMRWGAPPQPSPIAVDQNHHHHMDHTGGQVPQPSPVTYGYMLDGSDRALSYSPAADQSMMAPFPTPTSTDAVVSGFPHHPQGGQQLTPTMSSPAFAQFPGTPQSFIATSPQENDPNGQQMMQRTPVEPQQTIYSMPQAQDE